MCGIAGFNFNNKGLIGKMNDVQKLRGPDGEGTYLNGQVSLGHRRLAIIDLSEAANQPMHYKHLSIVFNGEIYNYKEIRKELKQTGHEFVTNSDTEVVLHAFDEWGQGCQTRFNGMWAFCIYDKQQQTLFLSRDRFGIKPLYYYFNGGKFIFASQVKAIQCHQIGLEIDNIALHQYLYQKYIAEDCSIFKQIKKLKEGNCLIFKIESKEFEIKPYYHLETEIEKAKEITILEKKQQIEKLIEDAVEKRLVSDVPIGSFLSGGVDSSLISALIAKKHPRFDVFSIGFKEQSFNELDYAKLVAKHIGVEQHHQTLSIDEDLVFDIVGRLDEPFGDASVIPTSLLSKITREKVTVSLSGDAGDEVFGGYDTYLAWKISRFVPSFIVYALKKLTWLLPASDKNLHFSFKIKKFLQDWHKNANQRHLNWMSQTTEKQRKLLLKTPAVPTDKIMEAPSGKNLLSIQLNDIKNYMNNDILRKVDIASMLWSLEVRVPFLDYRLVPLVLSLCEKEKIKGRTTKYFLKTIAGKLIPKKIIQRKKAGFAVPLSLWFKKSEKMQEIITNKAGYGHNLFNYEYAQTLLNQHLKGKNDNSRVLWLIFVFNVWYKNQEKLT